MVATGGDAHLVLHDLVDQSMLIQDTAGPVASEVVLQGPTLTDPFVAVADDILDEQVDPLEGLAVLILGVSQRLLSVDGFVYRERMIFAWQTRQPSESVGARTRS